MFCWETLASTIHGDVPLTKATYLIIVADQVEIVFEMVLCNNSGISDQNNAPCHSAKLVQEWIEEHNNDFEMLTWPLSFANLVII